MCTDLREETQSLPRNIARTGVSGSAFRRPEVTAAQLSVWAILNASTHQHFCSTGSAKTVNVPTQTDTSRIPDGSYTNSEFQR